MRWKRRVLPVSIEGMPVFLSIQTTATILGHRQHRLVACRCPELWDKAEKGGNAA